MELTMVNSECFHRQEATFYTYDGSETRFSRDISPIILAAQRSEYAIINMLVQRGATIEKPHRKRFFISYNTREYLVSILNMEKFSNTVFKSKFNR